MFESTTFLKKSGKALAGFALAVTCLLPAVAQAVTIAPPVTIQEIFNSALGQGEYTVTNHSGVGIYAFFVGNNLASGASVVEPAPLSWTGVVISRSDWEGGRIPFPTGGLLPGGETDLPIGRSWTPPDTTALDWDSIFGPGYTQAVGYWSDGSSEIPQEPITDGSTVGGFLFSSQIPASPFVAFGSDGGIVGQGATSVVPLPPAVWLFGSAVVGWVGLRKPRR